MKGILQITISMNIPPIHENVFNKHITVCFGADQDKTKHLIGQRVTIELLSHYSDEKGQCVSVNYTHPELSALKNRLPHITISCAPGVKPMYSNELIQKGTNKEGCATTSLDGIVEFKPF